MAKDPWFRACVCLALLGGACGGGAPAPTSASRLPGDYINEILTLMQGQAIHRARIDWTDFRARVTGAAQGAQTIPELYPAISLALGMLEDRHSYYVSTSGSFVGNPGSPRCPATPVAAPATPPDLGYVRIRSFSSAEPNADRQFADEIAAQIRSRDTAELAGWIVDLRGNGGGNMWPMIAGVGPVLGEGVAGYFIPPVGAAMEWGYSDGGAFSGSSVVVRTSQTYTLIHRAPRVAVLTDLAVASSGEAVAVAFRARPNTRSFGSPTCGLSTANQNFRLSDGATLFLTVSVMADRTRAPYGLSLAPDEPVSGDAEVVQSAIDWLRER
ncbi:MAG TPA: S41 family peptidase [Vicinamibacteria bacterium]|nr:S41 family peptidase [Vicinamibacteria bacterium]